MPEIKFALITLLITIVACLLIVVFGRIKKNTEKQETINNGNSNGLSKGESEMIRIPINGFYTKPEYSRFMPKEIFNAIELAELKGSLQDNEILAEVPMTLYDKMIEDITNYQKNHHGEN